MIEDEEIEIEHYSHGFSDCSGESYMCCPYCLSDDVYEVEKCELCGEYVDKYTLDFGICEDCIKKNPDILLGEVADE